MCVYPAVYVMLLMGVANWFRKNQLQFEVINQMVRLETEHRFIVTKRRKL